jgi:hypothetical protein
MVILGRSWWCGGNYDAAPREAGNLPGRTEGGCARAKPVLKPGTSSHRLRPEEVPAAAFEHEELVHARHPFSVV